jgi:hypothetical protein
VSAEKVNLGAELAIRSLIERAPLASSLAQAFKAEGFQLALVGGPVRDAILGRLGNDLDFTTDAHPHQTKKILVNQMLSLVSRLKAIFLAAISLSMQWHLSSQRKSRNLSIHLVALMI